MVDGSRGDPLLHRADYGVGTGVPAGADIPAGSPLPSRPGGLATGALAVGGVLFKFKFLLATFISTGVTAFIYAQLFGWAFAVGLVSLILVHESGHLVVARALGMRVTMPVLIPFIGAFVNVRQAPRTVVQEAEMAIGGPILGSLGAGLCFLVYAAYPGSSLGSLMLALAYFGFLINAFNLIPVTPLDGGRVLSLVSKWFNLAGLAIAAAVLLLTHFRSPILLLVLIFGAFSTLRRFRAAGEDPAYYQVSARSRVVIGALYLALLLALGLGLAYTRPLLQGSL